MLVISDLSKTYTSETAALSVLQKVSLAIEHGELCAITGASGSGKTTLMNLMGLLDRPDAGRITINGLPVYDLQDDHIASLRNRLIGFVFQSFHLLPNLSALDNVALPLIYRGISLSARRAAATVSLKRVGLEAHFNRLPDQLSGGQKQRVAIARALVGSPALILADEPTGNLDSGTSDEIMNLFLDLNRTDRTTLVLVTHDPSIAARCPRRIIVRDGRIVDDNRGELRDAAFRS
ncbi:ABC transporter ATP-binding protein [Bradyrhizobium betae]|uniref:Macrolide ABC transporter ATP-binding protein n=1 Tax=Bradyrhizobium betae TaxID=244734 RepID=A0A4V1P451_9BRAD|nr:ABC transporter ATP-binding protein [Bradyrhizobium betae]RXT36372.1 macrolide ABC transporter ATP-binding protein [Bradyrhizobium betae]